MYWYTFQIAGLARITVRYSIWTNCNFNILSIFSYKIFKKRNAFYKRIFKRIFLISGFGLFIYLLPILTIIKFQYRDYPDYIKAYENYLSDPKNESLKNEKDIQYYKMVMTEEEFKSFLEYEKKLDKME